MKKKIIISLAVFLALLGLFGILMKMKNTSVPKPNSTTTNGPTLEQQQAEAKVNADTKKALIEGTDSSTPSVSTTTPSLDLSARSETNGTVTVLTKLYNISSGTCNLAMVNGSKQKNLSANVIYQPEYSSCAGFSVPQNDLGPGTWAISLSVKTNTSIYEKTINYEVK